MSARAAGAGRPFRDIGSTSPEPVRPTLGQMPDDLNARLADALERLSSALRHADQQHATRAGLSPLQLRLLRALAAEHAPGRIGQLASHLDIAQPTATDAIATLDAKGLVHRRPDPADRRATTVTLTPSGRAVLADLGDPRTLLEPALHRLPAADKTAALAVVLATIADLYHRGIITTARTCLTCRHFRTDHHPDPDTPHHCALLDLPLAPAHLRVNCADHEPANG